MTSGKFATPGNFSATNLSTFIFVFFLSETRLLSLVIIKQLKIKNSLNESVKDRKDVRQSKDLSGQYPILTGHCPLIGRYLQP